MIADGFHNFLGEYRTNSCVNDKHIYGICHKTFARKSLFFESSHYSYVIMSAMASQITSFMIVYSTVYSRLRSKKTSRLRGTALCAGKTPVTGEFPAPLQWRHNGHNSVSNHQPHDCLLNHLFRRRSKKTREMFPFDDVIMYFVNITPLPLQWNLI